MTAVMASTWLIVIMVYLDRFFPPFHRLELWFMPWKGLYRIPSSDSLEKRLATMQSLLDSSHTVAYYAFALMLVSFTALSIYLSVVYEQKRRRARENMLLAMKNKEIARRNEFIRYISATIGHEFKNNLGRIKRRIELLSDVPSEAQERIDDNFDKLFADIDIFKKISDQRESGLAQFTNVNIREMIDKLAADHKDMAQLTVHDHSFIPLIYASPPLIQTVFENIIDNAIKYKKPEQVRALIDVFCDSDTDFGRRYVSVAFRDQGQGMDDFQADKCFYQGKARGENWGQGLFYAKYVAGLHAGRIRINKENTAPGKGTEIIINLPFVEESDV